MEQPQDKENALAGLLTGLMLTLSGGAFPALLIWFVATHWEAVISGSHTIPSVQAMQGVGALAFSAPVFRFGVRMLTLNAAALRRL